MYDICLDSPCPSCTVTLDTRTLVNAGTLLWRQGMIHASHGAMLSNQGVMKVLGTGEFTAQGGATIVNSGFFFKFGDKNGATVLDPMFVNTGAVRVLSG